MSLNVDIAMLDHCPDNVMLDGPDHNESGMDAFHCGLSVMERLTIRVPNESLPTSLDLFDAYHWDKSYNAHLHDELKMGVIDVRWWMDDGLTEDETLQGERYAA